MTGLQKVVEQNVAKVVKLLECAICLDFIENPVVTQCHHKFCRNCFMTFLQRNHDVPCPLCKNTVTKRCLQPSTQLPVIVTAAKLLVEAFKKDTGVDVTPRREHGSSQSESQDLIVKSRVDHNVNRRQTRQSNNNNSASKSKSEDQPKNKRHARKSRNSQEASTSNSTDQLSLNKEDLKGSTNQEDKNWDASEASVVAAAISLLPINAGRSARSRRRRNARPAVTAMCNSNTTKDETPYFDLQCKMPISTARKISYSNTSGISSGEVFENSIGRQNDDGALLTEHNMCKNTQAECPITSISNDDKVFVYDLKAQSSEKAQKEVCENESDNSLHSNPTSEWLNANKMNQNRVTYSKIDRKLHKTPGTKQKVQEWLAASTNTITNQTPELSKPCGKISDNEQTVVSCNEKSFCSTNDEIFPTIPKTPRRKDVDQENATSAQACPNDRRRISRARVLADIRNSPSVKRKKHAQDEEDPYLFVASQHTPKPKKKMYKQRSSVRKRGAGITIKNLVKGIMPTASGAKKSSSSSTSDSLKEELGSLKIGDALDAAIEELNLEKGKVETEEVAESINDLKQKNTYARKRQKLSRKASKVLDKSCEISFVMEDVDKVEKKQVSNDCINDNEPGNADFDIELFVTPAFGTTPGSGKNVHQDVLQAPVKEKGNLNLKRKRNLPCSEDSSKLAQIEHLNQKILEAEMFDLEIENKDKKLKLDNSNLDSIHNVELTNEMFNNDFTNGDNMDQQDQSSTFIPETANNQPNECKDDWVNKPNVEVENLFSDNDVINLTENNSALQDNVEQNIVNKVSCEQKIEATVGSSSCTNSQATENFKKMDLLDEEDTEAVDVLPAAEDFSDDSSVSDGNLNSPDPIPDSQGTVSSLDCYPLLHYCVEPSDTLLLNKVANVKVGAEMCQPSTEEPLLDKSNANGQDDCFKCPSTNFNIDCEQEENNTEMSLTFDLIKNRPNQSNNKTTNNKVSELTTSLEQSELQNVQSALIFASKTDNADGTVFDQNAGKIELNPNESITNAEINDLCKDDESLEPSVASENSVKLRKTFDLSTCTQEMEMLKPKNNYNTLEMLDELDFEFCDIDKPAEVEETGNMYLPDKPIKCNDQNVTSENLTIESNNVQNSHSQDFALREKGKEDNDIAQIATLNTNKESPCIPQDCSPRSESLEKCLADCSPRSESLEKCITDSAPRSTNNNNLVETIQTITCPSCACGMVIKISCLDKKIMLSLPTKKDCQTLKIDKSTNTEETLLAKVISQDETVIEVQNQAKENDGPKTLAENALHRLQKSEFEIVIPQENSVFCAQDKAEDKFNLQLDNAEDKLESQQDVAKSRLGPQEYNAKLSLEGSNLEDGLKPQNNLEDRPKPQQCENFQRIDDCYFPEQKDALTSHNSSVAFEQSGPNKAMLDEGHKSTSDDFSCVAEIYKSPREKTADSHNNSATYIEDVPSNRAKEVEKVNAFKIVNSDKSTCSGNGSVLNSKIKEKQSSVPRAEENTAHSFQASPNLEHNLCSSSSFQAQIVDLICSNSKSMLSISPEDLNSFHETLKDSSSNSETDLEEHVDKEAEIGSMEVERNDLLDSTPNGCDSRNSPLGGQISLPLSNLNFCKTPVDTDMKDAVLDNNDTSSKIIDLKDSLVVKSPFEYEKPKAVVHSPDKSKAKNDDVQGVEHRKLSQEHFDDKSQPCLSHSLFAHSKDAITEHKSVTPVNMKSGCSGHQMFEENIKPSDNQDNLKAASICSEESIFEECSANSPFSSNSPSHNFSDENFSDEEVIPTLPYNPVPLSDEEFIPTLPYNPVSLSDEEFIPTLPGNPTPPKNEDDVHDNGNKSNLDLDAVQLTDEDAKQTEQNSKHPLNVDESAHQILINFESVSLTDPDMAFANSLVAPLQTLAKNNKIAATQKEAIASQIHLSPSIHKEWHDDTHGDPSSPDSSFSIRKKKSSCIQLLSDSEDELPLDQNKDDSDSEFFNPFLSQKAAELSASVDNNEKDDSLTFKHVERINVAPVKTAGENEKTMQEEAPDEPEIHSSSSDDDDNNDKNIFHGSETLTNTAHNSTESTEGDCQPSQIEKEIEEMKAKIRAMELRLRKASPKVQAAAVESDPIDEEQKKLPAGKSMDTNPVDKAKSKSITSSSSDEGGEECSAVIAPTPPFSAKQSSRLATFAAQKK